MYTLPNLPYAYDALEPTISDEIMKLHHQKHHQTYVDKLNAALQKDPDSAGKPLADLLASLDAVPQSIRTAVRNHGGGHYNHSLFWEVMSPDGGGEPSDDFRQRIDEKYESFEAFIGQFNEKALGLFGSGWVWLTKDLETIALPNQDTPMALGLGEPILGLDVWEHAYYLDYRNKRDDYIAKWWDVVNWPEVERRYHDAQKD